MKISFDLRKTGLGNNGGSLTLIKCANTLVDLGNQVYFIDSGKNRNTWVPLKAEHIIAPTYDAIPDADVLIATGFGSVRVCCHTPDRCGKKFHYIRGWETWIMPEKHIEKFVVRAKTNKIVNGMCLQNKLKSYGEKSEIIRPGYDLNNYSFDNKRNRDNTIIIGGLYTDGKHVHTKRPQWIFEAKEYLKLKGIKVKLFMFGASKNPRGNMDYYVNHPTIDEKNDFYNQIDIWLAPSIMEGLHNPPAEAMMTNCPVITTNAPMAGTQDYVIHEENGIIVNNNLDEFLFAIENLCHDKQKRIKLSNKCREKIESLGTREQNMKKMMSYFKRIIKDGKN
jgi:glycosyltransferase involved in cell wall biosynthesis